MKRQPRKAASPRAVISLSLPIDPDYVRAQRAAGVKGETLAEFMREAIRQRVNRTIGKSADELPLSDAA